MEYSTVVKELVELIDKNYKVVWDKSQTAEGEMHFFDIQNIQVEEKNLNLNLNQKIQDIIGGKHINIEMGVPIEYKNLPQENLRYNIISEAISFVFDREKEKFNS